MSEVFKNDAVIFELHAMRYPIGTYQEILMEAASCGIDWAVYILTKDSLDQVYQDQQRVMSQKLEIICDVLDMKLIKAPIASLPNIFENPRVGKVNEFGEVVSSLVGLPSLREYQEQYSMEEGFVRKRSKRK